LLFDVSLCVTYGFHIPYNHNPLQSNLSDHVENIPAPAQKTPYEYDFSCDTWLQPNRFLVDRFLFLTVENRVGKWKIHTYLYGYKIRTLSTGLREWRTVERTICLHVLYCTCLRAYIYMDAHAHSSTVRETCVLSNEERKKRNNGKSAENEFTCFRTHACYALQFSVIQSDVWPARDFMHNNRPPTVHRILRAILCVQVRKRRGISSTCGLAEKFFRSAAAIRARCTYNRIVIVDIILCSRRRNVFFLIRKRRFIYVSFHVVHGMSLSN